MVINVWLWLFELLFSVWRREWSSLWWRSLYVPWPESPELLLHSRPWALRLSGDARPAVQWGGAMFWSYSGPVQCLVQIDAWCWRIARRPRSCLMVPCYHLHTVRWEYRAREGSAVVLREDSVSASQEIPIEGSFWPRIQAKLPLRNEPLANNTSHFPPKISPESTRENDISRRKKICLYLCESVWM